MPATAGKQPYFSNSVPIYVENLLSRLEGNRLGRFPWNVAGRINQGSSSVRGKVGPGPL